VGVKAGARAEGFILFLNAFSVLAAPLGGAAAAERQGALNALDMDCSSCDFDRARNRPAKIIKGAKKAACCPKTKCSPQRLARHPALPFFLPAASLCHEVLTVAQLGKADAACAEADTVCPDEKFCYVDRRLSLLRLLSYLAQLSFLSRNCAKTPGRGLIGVSAAAPEVPPDVESGSVGWGVPGGAKTSHRSETRAGMRMMRRRRKRRGREEDEEEDEAEGDEDLGEAPNGPRCMDPADPATRSSCPAFSK
jgi:hypothetical protein